MATIIPYKDVANTLKYDFYLDENDFVIFCDGDTSLEYLDLDAPQICFKDLKDDKRAVGLVVINGNLTIQNIYNYEIDGAINLYVKKNLYAKNIVVGGQDIIVGENLEVDELFWGDYRGTIQVDDKITAKLFITTRDYGYNYAKTINNTNIAMLIDDEIDDDEIEFNLIARYLKDEILSECEDAYSFMDHIDQKKLIDAINGGKSVINKPFLEEGKEEILSIFSNAEFDDEQSFQEQIPNFDKLISLIPDNNPEQFYRSELFQAKIYISKEHKRKSDGRKVDAAVTILCDNGDEIYIWRKFLNPIKNIFSKNPTLICVFKSERNGLYSPRNAFDDLEILNRIKNIWRQILDKFQRGFHYKNELDKIATPQTILDITSLPLVTEKYNDWYDDDKHGDWFKSKIYSFCMNGFDEKPAILRIGAQTSPKPFDARFYYYENDEIQNPKNLILRYRSSQRGKDDYYGNESKIVPIIDDGRMKEAFLWFKRGVKNIQIWNKSYLVDKKISQNEQAQLEDDIRNYAQIKPFENIEIGGVRFKVLDRREANEILKDLVDTDGMQIYDAFRMDIYILDDCFENTFFLLCEDEVRMDSLELALHVNEISEDDFCVRGYIFKENLNVEKAVFSANTFETSALICLKNLNVKTLLLKGSSHYFGGDIEAINIWGEFGRAHIIGEVKAALMYSNEFMINANFIQLDALICDEGNVYAKENIENGKKEVILEQWATHNAVQCVQDRFLQNGELISSAANHSVQDALIKGENLLDYTLMQEQKSKFESEFSLKIHDIFNSSKLKNLDEDEVYYIPKEGAGQYYFYNARSGYQVGYWNADNTIVAYIYISKDANNSSLNVYYYEDDKAKYTFETAPDDGFSATFVAQRVFYEASAALISEISKSETRKKIAKIKENLSGECLQFSDFNFKLTVIQELMYEQEILEPKFDLYEFAQNYKQRKIDIEKEGYRFIPEATKYFQELKIPKEFASFVTKLEQDGGDEIYTNILRFASGSEQIFNIQSAKDAAQFPNLAWVDLCYATDEAKDEFRKMGIEIKEYF